MIFFVYRKDIGGITMKNSLTELVFILDRSGSMSGLENDTIGGFNSMIEKQKREDGDANVTTVLFDHTFELLHDSVNLSYLQPMSDKEYYVRGSTALLDAIGKTIKKMVRNARTTPEHMKAEHVIFVITTDGMENSSVEYSYSQIRNMIEFQKERYNWEFIFLGANMDAIKTAEQFGIKRDRSATYHADSFGTALNYDVLNEAIKLKRANLDIPENWKERIEKDYKNRK